MSSVLTFVLCSMLAVLVCTSSSSPTWSLTSAIKTGTRSLLTSLTTPGQYTYTITFSSFFSGSTNPIVAYGIEKYRGTDYLIQESFALTLTGQSFMDFSLQLDVINITNPVLLAVSYIAVDPNNFLYYYNAFTEVPLNYGSLLSNFSTPSLNLQYHYEVVDYTNDENVNYGSLGPGSAYTTFTAPFTQYRIALFLTSIAITATANSSIHFDITANVIDANTYAMNATLGYNSTITMLQFSQVFFDSSQFSTSSNKYLYFQEWAITNTATTSFFQYNNALAANFMMGLKSFSATGGLCSFEYQWINTWVSSNYGAQVQTSSPYNTTCGFSGDVSTILLMMTWSCPGSQPYFDLTTQMCLSSCNPYTYLNATDNSCHVCLNPTCYTCNALNSNLCLTCATNFVVVSNSCICDTSGGYYLSINGQCYSCSNLQSNCQICSYAGNVSLAYSSTDFTCLTCNAAAGYFIDPNNNCQPCSVQYCTTCIGYVTCSVCQAGYGVTATGACSTCPITGCQTCSNLTSCSVCQTGYIKINNLCYTCPTSCTCGGYTLPKYANGDCSTICGDGIVIFPYEGCDDSNTNNGDGCSSSCQIQTYSTCSGQPSICYYTSTIAAQLVSTTVSAQSCNVITFNFQVSPSLQLLSNPNITWTNAISPQNASALSSYISSSYSNGVISQTYSFSRDLQSQNLTFKLYPQFLNSSTYLHYTPSSALTFAVLPANNIPAVYCPDATCKGIAAVQSFAKAEEAISYIGLLLSTVSCKIIGLEMFGVLQLSYFSLSNYDYVPPALIGLLQRKEVNGLNIGTSASPSSSIPSRVTANGYNSSVFLANFNIMLLVTALIAGVGLVMYMVTYLLNKDSIDSENLSEALESNSGRESKEKEESRSQFWHRMSKYILKEVLLTFVIFNMFNISYSAGIQIKYIEEVDSFSIICLLVTLTVVIVIAVAQVATGKEEFGEYIDKFKKEKMESRYIIATIIYRFILGFLLAVINDWVASGIVYTFLSGAFLAYICYFEPFTDPFQNVRSKFIHSVHVLILFVNFYYRMEANSNAAEASQLSVPAYVQIIAVAVSVFGSTLLLGYEAFLKLKSRFWKSPENGQVSAQGQDYIKKQQLNQQETIQEIQD